MSETLLTAWLSWYGGVTFTLTIVFAFASAGVFLAEDTKRTPVYAILFAVLTLALAVVQIGRLGYV